MNNLFWFCLIPKVRDSAVVHFIFTQPVYSSCRASHCARAFEECDRQYKAVFARPREVKGFSSDFNDNSHSKFNNSYGSQRFDSGGPGMYSP